MCVGERLTHEWPTAYPGNRKSSSSHTLIERRFLHMVNDDDIVRSVTLAGRQEFCFKVQEAPATGASFLISVQFE